MLNRRERFLTDYQPWVISHGRLPACSAHDPAERSLGRWKSKNSGWRPLQDFNNQFKPLRRTQAEWMKLWQAWEKTCPDRKPSQRSEDPFERSLSYWLYRKGTRELLGK